MVKKFVFSSLLLLNCASILGSEAVARTNALPEMPNRTVNLPVQGQQVPQAPFVIDQTLPIAQRLNRVLQHCRMTAQELRTRGKMYEFKVYNPTFAGDVLEEVSDIIVNLKDRRRGYGPHILFHGPKGSGKTTLAAYISAQAEIPMVTVHAAWFINGYLGGGAQRVQELINDAQRVQELLREPIIICIEELDHIANEEKSDSHGESDRITGAIWTALEVLERGKIIFICTTNKEKQINDRLSSRLREIEIKSPDQSAREVHLRAHLGNEFAEADIKKLAETEIIDRRQLNKSIERAREQNYANRVRQNEREHVNNGDGQTPLPANETPANARNENNQVRPLTLNDLEIALFTTQNVRLPDPAMRLKLLGHFLQIEQRKRNLDADCLFLPTSEESLILERGQANEEVAGRYQIIRQQVLQRSQTDGIKDLAKMLSNQKCDHNHIQKFIESAASIAVECNRRCIETFDCHCAYALSFPETPLNPEQRNCLIKYYIRHKGHTVSDDTIKKLCARMNNLNERQINQVIEEAHKRAATRRSESIEDTDFLIALLGLSESTPVEPASERAEIITYLLKNDSGTTDVSERALTLVANNSSGMSFEQIKNMLTTARNASNKRDSRTLKDEDLYVGLGEESEEKCDLRKFEKMKEALLAHHLCNRKWEVGIPFIKMFAKRTNTEKIDADQIKAIVEHADRMLLYYKTHQHVVPYIPGGMTRHEVLLFYAARKYNHIVASGYEWCIQKFDPFIKRVSIGDFIPGYGIYETFIETPFVDAHAEKHIA